MKLANLVDGLVVSEGVPEVVAEASSEAAEEEVVADMAETEAMAVTGVLVVTGAMEETAAMAVAIEAMVVGREVMEVVTDPMVAAVVDTPTGVEDTPAAVDTGITGTRGDTTALEDPTETVTTVTLHTSKKTPIARSSLRWLYLKRCALRRPFLFFTFLLYVVFQLKCSIKDSPLFLPVKYLQDVPR